MAAEVNRRTVMIAGLGTCALGLTVAGCGSDSGDSAGGFSDPAWDTDASGAAPSAPPSQAPSEAPSEEPSAPPTTAQQGGGGGGQQTQGLIALNKLAQGKTTQVKDSKGRTLLLTRTGAATVTALDAKCTHQGCTVPPSGLCPCHGSKFVPATGAVVNGPAQAPLARVKVVIQDGQVVLAG